MLMEEFVQLQRIAGEIKSFSTDGWVAPKLSKRMDKFMLYMLTAGKKALKDGGVTEDVMKELNKTKCGVLIGSGMGGMKVILVVTEVQFFLSCIFLCFCILGFISFYRPTSNIVRSFLEGIAKRNCIRVVKFTLVAN